MQEVTLMSDKVRLTQLSSTHDRVRTKEIEGTTAILPRVGETFVMFGEPLEIDAGVRVLWTSEIQEVEQPERGVWIFRTENSTYKLELL